MTIKGSLRESSPYAQYVTVTAKLGAGARVSEGNCKRIEEKLEFFSTRQLAPFLSSLVSNPGCADQLMNRDLRHIGKNVNFKSEFSDGNIELAVYVTITPAVECDTEYLELEAKRFLATNFFRDALLTAYLNPR